MRELKTLALVAGATKLEAITPITQSKRGKKVYTYKVNVHTIPAKGHLGSPDFVSLYTHINSVLAQPKVPSWKHGVPYTKGSLLLHNGNLVVCIRACKDKAPHAHSAYWRVYKGGS